MIRVTVCPACSHAHVPVPFFFECVPAPPASLVLGTVLVLERERRSRIESG